MKLSYMLNMFDVINEPDEITYTLEKAAEKAANKWNEEQHKKKYSDFHGYAAYTQAVFYKVKVIDENY